MINQMIKDDAKSKEEPIRPFGGKKQKSIRITGYGEGGEEMRILLQRVRSTAGSARDAGKIFGAK